MVRQELGVVLLCGLLAACNSIEPQPSPSLTEEQKQEIEAWEQEAQNAPDVVLTDDWAEVAPGVHRLITHHDGGGVTVQTRIEGLEALEWVATNEWQPRLAVARARLTSGEDLSTTAHDNLQYEIQELQVRLDRLQHWRELAATPAAGGDQLTSASCTPKASASAMPTTSSQGAKAYASARTCEADTAFARASAAADGVVDRNYTYPETGETGSVSATEYGSNCESSAWAEAYPLATDSDYYGC